MPDLRVGGVFQPDQNINFTGAVSFGADQFTTNVVGAIPVTVANTVTAVEKGTGLIHQTVISMANTPVTFSDTNVGGGVKLYTFPKGRILILGVTGTSAITTTSVLASTLHASVTCNWGVGTVITTTQGSGTLTTTQVDLLPSVNITSSATINVTSAATSTALAAAAQFDGTTTAKVINWNIGIAGATDIDADATITVVATLTFTWMWLGTY